jgi:uracil phosphoribosyltransferase
MKDILLTVLRNNKTTRAEFRLATEKLGTILAFEVSQLLERKYYEVETPLEKFPGDAFKNNVIMIPIMRSGLALLPPFLHYYEMAKVGFIGAKRDEETATPHLYYHNLPSITPNDDVIILEPMIATGGSVTASIQFLEQFGIREEKIIVVSIIGAEEGIAFVQKKLPKVRLVISQVDKELNKNKFILPGLGDFGDRYFGTEEHL